MAIKDKTVLDFTYDFYAKEVASSMPTPLAWQLESVKQALGVKNPEGPRSSISLHDRPELH